MNTRIEISNYLRQLAPHIKARRGTMLLEAALSEIDQLQAVAGAARHYANHYLLDERDEPDLCMNQQHYADVMALFKALNEIPKS